MAGGMVYVSSVGPIDLATGQVTSADITEQTRRCLTNLRAKLEAAGSSLAEVVWANWALRDPVDFDAFNEEWLKWFPGDGPIGQATLLPLSHRRAGFKISVGVIAASAGAPAVRSHAASARPSAGRGAPGLDRSKRLRRKRRPVVALPVERAAVLVAPAPVATPVPPVSSSVTIVDGGALPLGDIDPDLYARHFPELPRD
jgi:2-iminobutanoate/2-iminopropanoate deaminase